MSLIGGRSSTVAGRISSGAGVRDMTGEGTAFDGRLPAAYPARLVRMTRDDDYEEAGMGHVNRSVILSGLLAGTAALTGFGCESREESGAAGRSATVEERPYVTGNGTQQKQRSGT